MIAIFILLYESIIYINNEFTSIFFHHNRVLALGDSLSHLVKPKWRLYYFICRVAIQQYTQDLVIDFPIDFEKLYTYFFQL